MSTDSIITLHDGSVTQKNLNNLNYPLIFNNGASLPAAHTSATATIIAFDGEDSWGDNVVNFQATTAGSASTIIPVNRFGLDNGGAEQFEVDITSLISQADTGATLSQVSASDRDYLVYPLVGTVIEIANTDVNEGSIGPVMDSNPSSDNVPENATIGDTVGLTALATDPDGTASVTYSLINSAGGLFTIDSTTGVVKVNAALDAETATTHDITVLATSTDGSTRNHDYTVAVTDVNEFDISAVSDVDPDDNTVSEDADIGATIGLTLSAEDSDQSDSVTYSLVDDAGGLFVIDPDTGVVTVAGELDYEKTPSLSISVEARSTDGSVVRRDFTLSLIDVYDQAPPGDDTPGDSDPDTPDTPDPDDSEEPAVIDPEVVDVPEPTVSTEAAGVMFDADSLFTGDAENQQMNLLAQGRSRGDVSQMDPRQARMAPVFKDIKSLIPSDVWRIESLDINALNEGGYIPRHVQQSFIKTGAFILPIKPDVTEASQDEQLMTTVKLTAAATGLTVGSILWLLRSGGLMAISLLFYPAWRNVDPLPVLVARDEEDEEEDIDGDYFEPEGVELLVSHDR